MTQFWQKVLKLGAVLILVAAPFFANVRVTQAASNPPAVVETRLFDDNENNNNNENGNDDDGGGGGLGVTGLVVTGAAVVLVAGASQLGKLREKFGRQDE